MKYWPDGHTLFSYMHWSLKGNVGTTFIASFEDVSIKLFSLDDNWTILKAFNTC